MRHANWLEDLLKDLRFATRMLAENPLFSAIVVIILALGIGANTAIFSVTNAILLRTLPVRAPQELFYVRVLPGQPDGANNTGDSESSFSEPVFERMRSQTKAFSNLFAYVPAGFNKIAVRAGSTPEEASVEMVSGDFFSGLGVKPVCGHTFAMSDEKSHTAVAVLGFGFWSRRFGQDCSIIGKTLHIRSLPFIVIGIAPRNFVGVESAPTDVWVPLQNRPEMNAWGAEGTNYYADPKWWCLRLLGRIRPGLTPQAAQSMLQPAFVRAAYEPLGGKPHPGEAPRELELLPARGIGPSDFGKPLYVLLAMVALILVIACGNVSILLAARNTARQREFSIRLAIGGTYMRLFRQLLAESLILVIAGALLGWLFALVATRSLAVWSGIEVSLAPDAQVLLFTLLLSAIATLVFGLSPLYIALRTPIGLALKNTAGSSFKDKPRSLLERSVVVLQVALCLTLTVAAGLLMRTLLNLEHEALGLQTRGLLVFGLNPALKTHTDAANITFYRTVVDKLRTLPGVEAVTLMENRIGSGWSNNTNATVDGRDPRVSLGVDSNMMRWNAVGPNFFGTLLIPVLQGRDFNDADAQSAPKVAVVNQTFVNKFFNERLPLGHQVSFTSRFAFTVVGVVSDSKYTGVREKPIPMAYFPYTQIPGMGSMHIELRTAGDPATFLPAVRNMMAGLAPDLALLQPMTQQAQYDDSISQERLVARLALVFGLLAIVLVAAGLYGTLAYGVSRRTSELGVRMAIGAQPTELLLMILKESFAVCLIGVAAGLPLVYFACRLLASLLYGVPVYDAWTLALSLLVIVAVSLAAGLLPARRAASIDPLTALRHE